MYGRSAAQMHVKCICDISASPMERAADRAREAALVALFAFMFLGNFVSSAKK